MNESDAIDALEHLGLTSYEARVFVALQKLGTGTASDVDRIADVPRSQVYGAAEKLEERGLVEVQQSNPIRYRAVPLDEARERLRTRYERREDQAFDYLEDVRTCRGEADEHQEDVWTLHGQDSVTARAAQLVEDADERVLYGGGAEAFDDDLVAALRERGREGIAVTVVSAADTARNRFDPADGVATCGPPGDLEPDEQQTGRVLVVDDDTVLLSILGDEEVSDLRAETAIWSTDTGFAAVLIQLLDAWFEERLGG
ncbi:MAG: TrmB family transcriptional regulator [Halococcoides sp.]